MIDVDMHKIIERDKEMTHEIRTCDNETIVHEVTCNN
jgi:hypothetical protein